MKALAVIAVLLAVAAALYLWDRLAPALPGAVQNSNAGGGLDRSLAPYDKLVVAGPFRVTLGRGAPSLAVTGGAELLEALAVDERADTLTLMLNGAPEAAAPAEIVLRAQAVGRIEVLGGATLAVSGGVERDLRLVANDAAKVTLAGECGSLTVEAQGAAIVDAADYACAEVETEARGAAIVDIRASERLVARAGDAARILVHGEPETSEMVARAAATIAAAP